MRRHAQTDVFVAALAAINVNGEILLRGMQKRRMDFDANDVFAAGAQGASAGEDVRNERVFRMADLLAVHKHVGNAVQPLKA